MADYLELHKLKNDSDLQDKIETAVTIAAETIRVDNPGPINQTQRLIWAKAAMRNPKAEVAPMLNAVLAVNKDLTVEQILGAGPIAIQAQVDAAVDLFAGVPEGV